MTKRKLLQSKRKRKPQKQRRFRGWHWENPITLRPGEVEFVGQCRSRQDFPVFVKFAVVVEAGGCPRCRHCGKDYESVRRA